MDRSSQDFKSRNPDGEEYEEVIPSRIQSPFIKYSVTAVSSVLVCGVVFCFLLFQTNTIMDIDSSTVKRDVTDARIKVSSIVSNLNNSGTNTQSNPNVPGVTPTAPVGDGYYRYDENLVQKFLAAGIVGMDESRAKAISGLYVALGDSFPKAAFAGMAGNICHEGWPGMVQWGETKMDWDGPGTGYFHSSAQNPLYLRNMQNIIYLETHTPFGGIGLMGFTYVEWRREVAQKYRKYLPANDYLTDDDLRAAEVEYIVEMTIPRYEGIKNCSTPAEAATWWLTVYEQNGESYNQGRVDAAEQIYAIISSA